MRTSICQECGTRCELVRPGSEGRKWVHADITGREYHKVKPQTWDAFKGFWDTMPDPTSTEKELDWPEMKRLWREHSQRTRGKAFKKWRLYRIVYRFIPSGLTPFFMGYWLGLTVLHNFFGGFFGMIVIGCLMMSTLVMTELLAERWICGREEDGHGR